MLQSDTNKNNILKGYLWCFCAHERGNFFINQKDFLWERTSEPVLTRSKKNIKVKTFLVFIARNMVILSFLES